MKRFSILTLFLSLFLITGCLKEKEIQENQILSNYLKNIKNYQCYQEDNQFSYCFYDEVVKYSGLPNTEYQTKIESKYIASEFKVEEIYVHNEVDYNNIYISSIYYVVIYDIKEDKIFIKATLSEGLNKVIYDNDYEIIYGEENKINKKDINTIINDTNVLINLNNTTVRLAQEVRNKWINNLDKAIRNK